MKSSRGRRLGTVPRGQLTVLLEMEWLGVVSEGRRRGPRARLNTLLRAVPGSAAASKPDSNTPRSPPSRSATRTQAGASRSPARHGGGRRHGRRTFGLDHPRASRGLESGE